MAVLLAAATFLTYYFHAVLKIDIIFTHLFYIPIILAAMWWKRKGLIVAVFLGGLLILSDVLYKSGTPDYADILRSFMFFVISFFVVALSERLAKSEELANKRTIELMESEAKYRTLYESSSDAIMLLDEKRFFDCNNAALRIFGFSKKEDFIKMHPADVSPPYQPDGTDSLSAANNKISEAFRKGMNRFEWRHRRKNGEDFPADILLTVFPLKGKQVLQATVRDITEQKRAEETLTKSKEFTETVLNSMNDAISVIDVSDFRIIDVNMPFLKTYGLNREDVIGKTCYNITHKRSEPCVPPYDTCPLLKTLESGNYSTSEHVHYTANGNKYLEIATSPIKDENGKVINVIHVARDITERKQAEEALRVARDEAERANMAKTNFLQTMSHELRTPLNVILGFSGMLQRETSGELNEKQKHFVDNIITGGNNLHNVISQILEVVKTENGTLQLHIEKIPVAGTINEVLGVIKEKAAAMNVALEKDLDPRLGYIEADKPKFRQVLINLLDNAVKFSKPEGGTVTITAKKEGDMAKFSVSDTGIGMKEEDMAKIFQKFVQLDTGTTRKYGGVGLGLPITKQLVELHGGTITAESKYGEGSTFTFLLPVAAKKGSKLKRDEPEDKRYGFGISSGAI